MSRACPYKQLTFCAYSVDFMRNYIRNYIAKFKESLKAPSPASSAFQTVCRKPSNFSFVLSNAVVETVRVYAIPFIFFEADVRSFEIRITAWRERNQDRWHSSLRFSADCKRRRIKCWKQKSLICNQICNQKAFELKVFQYQIRRNSSVVRINHYCLAF